MVNIGKIENDFLELKMEIRRLIDSTIPEDNNKLNKAIKSIDSLIVKATNKKIREWESNKNV